MTKIIRVTHCDSLCPRFPCKNPMERGEIPDDCPLETLPDYEARIKELENEIERIWDSIYPLRIDRKF